MLFMFHGSNDDFADRNLEDPKDKHPRARNEFPTPFGTKLIGCSRSLVNYPRRKVRLGFSFVFNDEVECNYTSRSE